MIYMVFKGLPPSVNKAYFSQLMRKGKRVVPIRTLSTEGRAYKKEISTKVAREYGPEAAVIKKDSPYGLSIKLFYTTLLNTGWPTLAKTKYKKIDASNQIKLLEDALVTAFGIDDSQFLQVTVEKAQGPSEETHIWVWELNGDT